MGVSIGSTYLELDLSSIFVYRKHEVGEGELAVLKRATQEIHKEIEAALTDLTRNHPPSEVPTRKAPTIDVRANTRIKEIEKAIATLNPLLKRLKIPSLRIQTHQETPAEDPLAFSQKEWAALQSRVEAETKIESTERESRYDHILTIFLRPGDATRSVPGTKITAAEYFLCDPEFRKTFEEKVKEKSPFDRLIIRIASGGLTLPQKKKLIEENPALASFLETRTDREGESYGDSRDAAAREHAQIEHALLIGAFTETDLSERKDSELWEALEAVQKEYSTGEILGYQILYKCGKEKTPQAFRNHLRDKTDAIKAHFSIDKGVLNFIDEDLRQHPVSEVKILRFGKK